MDKPLLHLDFTTGKIGFRLKDANQQHEKLRKVLQLNKHPQPRVLDMTAGCGADMMIMAALGCTVVALERQPDVYHALNRALMAAQADPELSLIASRVTLHHLDAQTFVASSAKDFDILYIDPMFSDKSRKAQVNRNMQLLQQLVGDDEDSDNLLTLAFQLAPRRIIVKRPKYAPALNGPAPTIIFDLKSCRYDVYDYIHYSTTHG